MKGKPSVSVLIPAYNCEKYVSRAINSVLAQTFQDFECIVIDDGSKDKTGEKVRAFGDRVTYVRQANAGASAARNQAIALAQGEFLAFLDADDYWLPEKLEFQVRVFIEHPEVVLVHTDYAFHEDGAQASPRNHQPLSYEPALVTVHDDFDQVFAHPYLLTSSVMARAGVVRDAGGFDREFRTSEDVDLYYRCCWSRAYACIKQTLVCKHNLVGSLGNNIRSYPDNLEVMEKFLQAHPDYRDQRQELIASLKLQIYSNWIESLLYIGRGNEAREVLLRSREIGKLKHYRRLWLKSLVCSPVAQLKGRKRAA